MAFNDRSNEPLILMLITSVATMVSLPLLDRAGLPQSAQPLIALGGGAACLVLVVLNLAINSRTRPPGGPPGP